MYSKINIGKIKFSFILLIVVFSLLSCSNIENNQELVVKNEVNNNKIQITTSIIPLASISNYIWWEFVNAKALVPSGVSPRMFDLKPSQIVNIKNSDLIVFLWIKHVDWFLNKAIEWKNNVLAVSEGIEFLRSTSDKHHHEHKNHHDYIKEKNHKEIYSIDPHIWSSATNAYFIANSILNQLVKISPENQDYFEKNLKSFKNELSLAKKSFKDQIKWKKQTNFIVFHDAYNYLFEELNINQNNKHIFRKNMLSDPNSSEMKKLINKIWKLDIRVAFKEPQLDASSLKKLSLDHNLEIFMLNPLGTDESAKWFIYNYKNNLESLLKIYE